MKKILFFVLLLVGLCSFCFSEFSVSKGTPAAEIALKGVDGKKLKLSKLKGKMVLIDFWASWCGPCRRENPNVVEAYNKYKDQKFENGKGFEVFSVSLDRDTDAWKKAIETDQLVWKNHVLDDGTAAKEYGVRFIPSTFLVDGDGNIIAKGEEIRGMKLHLTLDKYVKK